MKHDTPWLHHGLIARHAVAGYDAEDELDLPKGCDGKFFEGNDEGSLGLLSSQTCRENHGAMLYWHDSNGATGTAARRSF